MAVALSTSHPNDEDSIEPDVAGLTIQSPARVVVKQAPTRVELAQQAIESLMMPVRPAIPGEATEVYLEAAKPGYQSSFSRDTAVTLELAGEADKLRGQLAFMARRQGQKAVPITWEEPGKIHHELPAVGMHGKSSAYNACDTTAEFLRSIAILAERGDRGLLVQYLPNITAAAAYIRRHSQAKYTCRDAQDNELGLFVEDPAFSGVDRNDDERRGALKVTYWKDSELNRDDGKREDIERPGIALPKYPIVYSLAHFQNAEALIRMGQVMGDQQLANDGMTMMKEGIKYLWQGDHFVTGFDCRGVIDQPSTDSLHALLHILPDVLPVGYAQKIEAYSEPLITVAGYRAGLPVSPRIDAYHTMYVWTHEQALLHAAAKRHGLQRAQAVSSRIVPFIRPDIGLYPELIEVGTFHPAGNARQAWAMGACIYFEQPDQALL